MLSQRQMEHQTVQRVLGVLAQLADKLAVKMDDQ
jgi:hypothetical protein